MTLAAMRSAAGGRSLGRGEKCRRRIKWGKWAVKGRGKGGFFGRGRQFPLSLTKEEGLFGAAQYIERRSLLAEEEQFSFSTEARREKGEMEVRKASFSLPEGRGSKNGGKAFVARKQHERRLSSRKVPFEFWRKILPVFCALSWRQSLLLRRRRQQRSHQRRRGKKSHGPQEGFFSVFPPFSIAAAGTAGRER